MPLIQSNLSASLEVFFSQPPPTVELCASKWAECMRNYALPVLPASTTVIAASEALTLALIPIFQTSLEASSTAVAMELAWLAFATTLGAGMQPAFTATPPPSQIGWLSLFQAPKPETHSEAASRVSNAIHVWMLTGIAVNNTSGATVNWS